MRTAIWKLLGMAFLWTGISGPALACSIVPGPPLSEQDLDRWAFQTRSDSYALVEVAVLDGARHPGTARARIGRVHWGGDLRGRTLRLRLTDDSCAPGALELRRGQSGFLLLHRQPERDGQLRFLGFVPEATLARWRRLGMLRPAPRR